MCFHSKLTKDATTLKYNFGASFPNESQYRPSDHFNGFTHPLTPIITNKFPTEIQLFSWGLIPSWAKDRTIQKSTVNARLDTLTEKPSFKYLIANRCMVLVDGFFEFQEIPGSKKKLRHLIELPSGKAFALCGLWNIWQDKQTGDTINSYTIITTDADEQMSKIHDRMPIILEPDSEKEWIALGKFPVTSPELVITPLN